MTPQFYQTVPPQPFLSGLQRLGGLRPEMFGSFNASLFTTATSGLTTYNGSTATTTNPYQNERIVRVQIVATGRSCGFSGSCGDLSATTGVIVYGLDAASDITAREILPNNQLGSPIPAGQGLCVGRRYRVSAVADRAQVFDWTTDLGSITSTGLTATLDLTQVTAANAPFQVQLTASARSTNQGCLSPAPATTAVFYFRDTPAPQNLRLDGNPQICSTPAARTIRVDPVAGATGYNWTVSGPGNINGSVVLPNGPNSISLNFTGPGTVQVQVSAQDNCSRLSPATTASFSAADPNAVPAPLPANLLQNYYSYPWSFDPRIKGKLIVSNPQSGIGYSFQVLDTELFNQKQPSSPGTTVSYYPSDPKTSGWGASYITLTQVTGGTLADIEILSPRVASVVVRVTAYNGCGANGATQTRDYFLTRPFYGYGLHRTAAGVNGDTTSVGGGGRVLASPAGEEAATPPVLYPNPAHDQLQIIAPSPATHYGYVVILNAQGTVVQEARSAEGVQLVSLQALPAGIYAVRLFDGQRFVTQHVAKD